jgi:hypothetical protein
MPEEIQDEGLAQFVPISSAVPTRAQSYATPFTHRDNAGASGVLEAPGARRQMRTNVYAQLQKNRCLSCL